jgi:chaperonin GroEL
MHRDIFDGEYTRLQGKAGIDKAANLVKVTMGIRGKNVVLDTNPYAKPLITNDGVTILRDMVVKDRSNNIGLKLIREAAELTNDNAGDGTTTTAILMQAIVDQGMKAISSGADGIQLRKGITQAVTKLTKSLRSEKVDATSERMLAQTATISCRDEKLGKLIAEVVKKSGVDGMITIEDRSESDTVYEHQEGLKLQSGFLNEFFVNLPERQQAVFSDVPILVTPKVITTGAEMGHIMEVVSSMGQKQAVIIAAGVEGDALTTAVHNWLKKTIHILPLRILTYGAGEGKLKDLASITGATYLDENEKNILDIVKADFGRAKQTVTDRHETIIITDDEKLKQERVKEIEAAIPSANEFETEQLKERIAKLNNAMFTVKVGGRIETERNELKTRVDDAIKAAKAALEDGVVAGGGSALYRAVQAQDKPDVTDDIGIGESIVYKACLKPIQQMAENSGYSLDKSDLKAILDKTKAIDFSSGEVVDAYKQGIIDPLKVVLECVQNSSTQAGLFLTLDGSVVDVVPEQAEKI